MATEKLLQEFPPVTTQEWEAVIHQDLKGADYQKKLVWQTNEGLAVKPYYRAEDIEPLEHLGAAPGDFPYLRGTRESADWRIREEIEASDPEAANRAAVQAVAAGAEEIAFTHCAVKSDADLGRVLTNLNEIPVRFENADAKLVELLAERKNQVTAGFDPLKDADFAAKIIAKLPATLKPFVIDGAKLEESGAHAVEQIGLALAAGIDYLAAMQSRGADLERAAAALNFSFATGASYFFEIAKLRAFRALWAQAAASFGVQGEGAKARIYARTSRWNKTVYDQHVNVLRGTTEAMAAVLGGADSVLVDPFDACYKEPDAASTRLARNTQILLKQEGLLSRVADPGAGAYCIEAITDYLGREAWKLMQRIEAAGGYAKAEAAGEVAAILKKSMSAKEKAVASRKRVFTGTNQYANLTEKALDRIDPKRVASRPRATDAYEQLRLRTERHVAKSGKAPRVLLAEIGDAKMRAARSGFAANFFACAGFEIVTQRFKTTDEIAAVKADVVVLCSSDPEYLALTTELKAKSGATPIVIAGNPENADALRAAGAVDFIHIRSNPLETLAAWQKRLGIEG